MEYIKGSPLNDHDLEKARAVNASACLVFANLRAFDPEADDAATVLRVLAIKNFCPTIKVQVSVIKTSTLVSESQRFILDWKLCVMEFHSTCTMLH